MPGCWAAPLCWQRAGAACIADGDGRGSAGVSIPGKPAFANDINFLCVHKDIRYLQSIMYEVREDSQANIPLLVKPALPVIRLSAMVRFDSCWKTEVLPEVLPHVAGNVPVKLRPCRYSVDNFGKDPWMGHDAGNVPVTGQSIYLAL